MNSSTKKWLFLKYSSAFLIPLKLWFIANFVSIYDSEYLDLINFFSSQPSKILFSLYLIFAFFFYGLTISEIFEDYIHNENIKNVANKALYIFAILMPLISISAIYKLTI